MEQAREIYFVCCYCRHRSENIEDALEHAYGCMPHRPMFHRTKKELISPKPSPLADPVLAECYDVSRGQQSLTRIG